MNNGLSAHITTFTFTHTSGGSKTITINCARGQSCCQRIDNVLIGQYTVKVSDTQANANHGSWTCNDGQTSPSVILVNEGTATNAQYVLTCTGIG